MEAEISSFRGPKRSKSLPTKAVKPGGTISPLQRSPTESPSPPRRRNSASNLSTLNLSAERLRNAKEMVEKAIRNKKVFTILGPYPKVREYLRQRGWVEKFYLRDQDRLQQTVKKSVSKSNNDEDDDDDGGVDDVDENEEVGKIPPWEEDKGIYGIMSRMVRNITPTFIWSLRSDQVDYKFLRRDQIVNHHSKSGCFTTKIGLCRNLRQLPWYDSQDSDNFYPRCHLLYDEDEMYNFIDDFRLTSCMSIVRLVGDSTLHSGSDDEEDSEEPTTVEPSNDTPKKSQPVKISGGHKNVRKVLPKIQYKSPRKSGVAPVAKSILEVAVQQCERMLQDHNHDNIDSFDDACKLSDEEWKTFINGYYRVVHEGAAIEGAAEMRPICTKLCNKLAELHTQFFVDGYRNCWIVKPGAKSRGRGVQCFTNIDQILSLVQTPGPNRMQNRYVVQKYIERPLLIHKTKWDLRQWFVVTDFCPLTIWWYADCYVRFCSQNFTLNDFNESVHLSNNSIQYKYENQTNRSEHLPPENMWHSDTLIQHFANIGQPDIWTDHINPGMKQAVINSMLCCADNIDLRKNCFELYGADFMVSDDFNPWLLEINASPTMAPSTEVTTKLCASLQEDILRLVLDKRGSNVGRFELIYKQTNVSAPNYAGIDLTLTGRTMSRPWNNSVVVQRPVEKFSTLLSEEKRLEKLEKEKEKRVEINRARLINKYKVSPASVVTTNDNKELHDLDQSETVTKHEINGQVTKTASNNLLSVSHRKAPTKVEIIPINTGLPKNMQHSSQQPSYFRGKTSSHVLVKPLGHWNGASTNPPLNLPSRNLRPLSSSGGRIIMPSSNKMSLVHRLRYSCDNYNG